MAPLPIPAINPIPLTDLDSAVQEPTHTAAARIDPYWDEVWAGSSSLLWQTRAAAEQATGSSTLGHYDRQTNPATLPKRLQARNRDFVDTMAALKMWRNATEDQLAAIAGWVHPSGPVPGQPPGRRLRGLPMRHLWRGGVVDLGEFPVPGLRATMPPLYRASTSDRSENLFNSLPPDVQHRIGDGHPWSPGHRHDRHNLITTELALRVAEYCEVLAVAGEDQASAARLDRSGIAARGGLTSHAGDALALRFDGARIVFEVTCTSNPTQVRKKVERWCEVLSRCSYDDAAIIVCFVEAGHHDRSNRQSLDSIADAILTELAHQPGAAADRLRERFAFVAWPWWFPTVGMANPSFATLGVLRPTGPSSAPWEETHLLDICDVGLFSMDGLAEELAKYKSLGGVPHWLR